MDINYNKNLKTQLISTRNESYFGMSLNGFIKGKRVIDIQFEVSNNFLYALVIYEDLNNEE